MDQVEYQLQRKRLRNLKNDFSTRPLPRTFRQLVLALLEHVNVTTLECWPAQPRLAAIVGVSIRSIRRNLNAVEKLGLFSINKGTGSASSRYKLRFDCPAWRKDKTAIVAEFVSKFTRKGIGVRTVASVLSDQQKDNRYGRSRPDSTDAGVRHSTDGVRTPASAELPQGSVVAAAKHASPPPQQLEENNLLAASRLAGSLAAAPRQSPRNFPSSSAGGDTAKKPGKLKEPETIDDLLAIIEAEAG